MPTNTKSATKTSAATAKDKLSFEIEKNGRSRMLVIRIPMNETPKPSSTGKTMIVATSNGNVNSGLMEDGIEIKIGVNAYIPVR